MWLQLGLVGGPSILPEPAQFPQPQASGGLKGYEKVSTGNESQEQLGPFGRQGPAAQSLRRLNGLSPPQPPPPPWVITTRCPAADVTLQGREGRGTLGSVGNSWTGINIPKGNGGGVGTGVLACSQCLAPGLGHGQHRVPPAGVLPSPRLSFLLNSPGSGVEGSGSLGGRKGCSGETL